MTTRENFGKFVKRDSSSAEEFHLHPRYDILMCTKTFLISTRSERGQKYTSSGDLKPHHIASSLQIQFSLFPLFRTSSPHRRKSLLLLLKWIDRWIFILHRCENCHNVILRNAVSLSVSSPTGLPLSKERKTLGRH